MTSRRSPTETRTPRMEMLARLPVFLALEGKRAVVAGGSAAAAWKAELLSAAGAHVDVYAAEPSDDLVVLAGEPPGGSITLHVRAFEPRDCSGAAIAVGAISDEAEAALFAASARRAGVPVNVIDMPAFCDFAFGAIVNRSPLVIGVSTDGAAPVFGQAIRAKLEALIPRGFSGWAQAARAWRPGVQEMGLSARARRLFWELFASRAAARPNEPPSGADLQALIEQMQFGAKTHEAGSVTLVGAGPGDPELLTLRAVRALQSADVILVDDLVAPEVLDFARREAKKMLVGKTGHRPSCKQDEINAMMISLAKAGRRVVRLKGGDPAIFGRAGEEIAACRAAGIPIDVIPGITAAQAAASRLGVSLTHRLHARRLQYVTGHGADGRMPDDIDWRSLADPSATTIVYMPKRTLGSIAQSAISHGLDPATPALVIVETSRAAEKIIRGTIADIAAQLEAVDPAGPALVMIGRVFAEEALAAASPSGHGSETTAAADRGSAY